LEAFGQILGLKDLPNLELDLNVVCLSELPPLKVNLPTRHNPMSKKRKYDKNKKFQQIGDVKLQWVELVVGEINCLQILGAKFVCRWKEMTKYLFLSGIHFVNNRA
jgi:hypothetical protein